MLVLKSLLQLIPLDVDVDDDYYNVDVDDDYYQDVDIYVHIQIIVAANQT